MAEWQSHNSSLETKVAKLSARLSELDGAENRHDLLDMELETAERRVEELSAQLEASRAELDFAKEETKREREKSQVAQKALGEVQVLLDKEVERANDFKVRNII